MRSLLLFGRCSFVITTAVASSSPLALLAAGLASLDGAGGGVLDVLLGGGSNHEGGHVDHLLANSDVSASDEDARVMDRGSELALDDEGLETSLHELGDSQTEHVIELAFSLLEEAKSDHASDDGLT